MSAPARQPVDAAHRDRVLRALGVTPWVQRAVSVGTGVSFHADLSAHGAVTGHRCVVVLPSGCSTRELDLVGRALVAGGAAFARAARITVSDGELKDVPAARAYLVFGEAQAHALGRALPVATMQQAQIVLADEPGMVLTRAESKRRLWSALRTVRRALAAAEG
ncbi:MAG TPA: hypothetical protein VIL60_07115 [Rhodanobacter sp.]